MRATPVIWISTIVLDATCKEATRAYPLETGGVLLGYWSGYDAVIVGSVGPGPAAIHGTDHYRPDHEYQRAGIAAAYAESARRVTYLGDWHSHPGGPAGLSKLDMETLRGIARHRRARAPHPLMLVLSGTQRWRLDLWQGPTPVQAHVRMFEPKRAES